MGGGGSEPDPNAVVRLNPRCMLTELGDGTGVVLDLDAKFYYTLNATGVFVWKSCNEQQTAESLADGLVASFEVEREVALRDVLMVLGGMLGDGLVQLDSAER